MVGSWMLWRKASYGMEMPFFVFQTLFHIQSNNEERQNEGGCYYVVSWGPYFICARSSKLDKGLEELIVLGF